MKTDILLKQFNQAVDILINALNTYSLSMLQQQPLVGEWSLGQMYTHILNDTEYYITQMKAALATTENSNENMHDDAKAMFARNSFPDIKIEGPATNTFIPQPQNKEVLLQRLLSVKATINQLFQSFDDARIQGKTQHPGLLFFTAQEWLQFAEMHIRHHLKQKERIEKVLGI